MSTFSRVLRPLAVLLLVAFGQLGALSQPLKLIRADKHFDRLNYSKALPLYLELSQEGYPKVLPQHVDTRIALCYHFTQKHSESLPWFEKAVAQADCPPEVLLRYAESLRINGQYKQSDKWLEAYNQAVPESSVATSLRGTDFNKLKQNAAYFVVDSVQINSRLADFSPAFFGNGIVFVSSRDTTSSKLSGWTNEPYYDLFVSQFDSLGNLSQPIKFSDALNTKYHEGPLVFSPDQQTVYFTRNNDKFGRKGKSADKTRLLKIYQATWRDGQWRDEQELPFNNNEYSCAHPTLSPDGQFMVFASSMPGGKGGTDLYLTQKTPAGWSTPQNLGETINTELNELFPSIADDGLLYFASDGHPGYGGLDIFYAERRFDSIQHIANMGPVVNSSLDDFGLIFNRGKGFFTTNKIPGRGDDLYTVAINRPPVAVNDTVFLDIIADSVEVATILPLTNDRDPDNSPLRFELIDKAKHATISLLGDSLVYTSKNDSLGVDSVRYIAYDQQGLASPAKVVVFRTGSNPPIAASDSLIMTWGEDADEVDICYNDWDPDQDLNPSSIEVLKEPNSAQSISFDGSNLTYVPYPEFLGRDTLVYKVFDHKGLSDIDSVFIDIRVIVFGVPLSEGMELSLTLLYDLGKAAIRPDAALILDSLSYYLKKYPGMEIEMGSHTDSRGGAAANQSLSERRAKSAVEYLASKDVDPSRLTYKGYGETRIINRCVDGVKCPESEHAVNRRTTVKVTKLRGVSPDKLQYYNAPAKF